MGRLPPVPRVLSGVRAAAWVRRSAGRPRRARLGVRLEREAGPRELRAEELVQVARMGVRSLADKKAAALGLLGLTRRTDGLDSASPGFSSLSTRHTSETVPCSRAWRTRTASGFLSSSEGSR